MLLAHAKTLAVEQVTRLGVKYPKNGPFTKEQQAAEDWEPVVIPFIPEPQTKPCADCPE